MHELHLETTRKTELVDVTARVREVVGGEPGNAAVLYVPHTTAGIVVQADGGLAVTRDVEAALERIVDEGWEWEHTKEEGDRNPWSHVRASLTALPEPDGAEHDRGAGVRLLRASLTVLPEPDVMDVVELDPVVACE